MPDYLIIILVIVVGFLLGLFIVSKVLKNKKIDDISKRKLPIDVNDVIEAVGGKNNIKDTNANGSKITFFLNDDSLVNTDYLKKLGAGGIVQTNSKITVIMGKFSNEISISINELLKK